MELGDIANTLILVYIYVYNVLIIGMNIDL